MKAIVAIVAVLLLILIAVNVWGSHAGPTIFRNGDNRPPVSMTPPSGPAIAPPTPAPTATRCRRPGGCGR